MPNSWGILAVAAAVLGGVYVVWSPEQVDSKRPDAIDQVPVSQPSAVASVNMDTTDWSESSTVFAGPTAATRPTANERSDEGMPGQDVDNTASAIHISDPDVESSLAAALLREAVVSGGVSFDQLSLEQQQLLAPPVENHAPPTTEAPLETDSNTDVEQQQVAEYEDTMEPDQFPCPPSVYELPDQWRNDYNISQLRAKGCQI